MTTPALGAARRAEIVVAIDTPDPAPADLAQSLARLPAGVTALELRADRMPAVTASWLRQHFSGRFIFSLRSVEFGGDFAGSAAERQARLQAAAQSFDLIELVAPYDLRPAILDAVPQQQRLITSYSGKAGDGLPAQLAALMTVPARLYRLISHADDVGQALAVMRHLAATGRHDLVAYATGEAGRFTRALSPWLGAGWAFSALHPQAGMGEFTVEQLLTDYGLPELPPLTQLYGIAGRRVAMSRSPRLHNAAYRKRGLPALFLPLSCARLDDVVRPAGLADFSALGLPLHGLTVTAPHKEAALQIAATASPVSRAIDAANLLLRQGSHWHADTTDPEGIVLPLRAHGIRLAEQEVAVVGCGGAGRAAAWVCQQAGARVTLVNRGAERGEHAARLLDLPLQSLGQFRPEQFAVLINATPCAGQDGFFPFDIARIRRGGVLVQLAYAADPAPFRTHAAASGIQIIDGNEVLQSEVESQFRHMTGQSFPAAPASAS
jgi:3-dehydroquinate dehydratase/shikimate dehydrogenase